MGWQRSFTLTLEDMGNRTFSCITWSPNGKTLAMGYTDGTVQLFGVETGTQLLNKGLGQYYYEFVLVLFCATT